MTLPLLAGIGEIAGDYDGFILDLWGVLHDGTAPFPGVLDALGRLRAAGKRIAILSNAPRRAAAVVERITEIGIAPEFYDHLHSSGEETWQHLAKRDDPFYRALGRRCWVIGPSRDDAMLTGLELTRVSTVEGADFILNIGPWFWRETVDDFEPVLQSARRRDVPMVCANPDLVVIHQGRRSICAGAIAQRYECLGGRVRQHGKPLPSVYETCFGLLGIADRRRILAVGDSLRTDIAGANGVGIDALLVADGIHGDEFGVARGELPDPTQLNAAVAASGYRPVAAVPRFRW